VNVLIEQVRAATRLVAPKLFERARLGREQLAALQTERLRDLLSHVAEHSPFYAHRLRGVDVARFELADLARLEPVSKPELMAALDDVFTDRALDRSKVEESLAQTGREPVPLVGRYLAQATGGSSGQRGVFVSDAATWAEVSGGCFRAILMHAPPRAAGRVRVAMVAAASAVHSTGLAAACNDPSGPVEMTSVPVTQSLDSIVERLDALQPDALIGYPTLIAPLARAQAAGRLQLSLRQVVTTSEMLTPELRAVIRSGFGVPVLNVFGTTEGLMGGSEPDSDVFTFNSDTCLVEIVDADHRPVPVGTPSSHVLITNLANRVQPLIRYQLDDRFTRAPDSPAHGHVRATIEGRCDDILRFGALEIHPLVVRAVLLKHAEITDYQVRQTARGLELLAVADASLSETALCRELHAALAAAGLRGAELRVFRVDAIPRHAETGKLKRFVTLR
jgi:phenylacetate-CoA ligase